MKQKKNKLRIAARLQGDYTLESIGSEIVQELAEPGIPDAGTYI
jgi:hypothetical protein